MQGELPRSSVAEMRYYTLQQMISEKLMLQQSRKAGVKVSKKELNDEVKRIKDNFAGDEEYKTWLEQNNFTEAKLRQLIQDNLRVTKLRDLKSKVEVTEEDVKNAYEQVRASHILVTPVGENWDAAKKQAEKILSEIKAGKNFADLAKKYSADTATKDKGGDLDYFGHDSGMDPEFAKAAFALKTGQVSEPVKSTYGYHLIKVTARKDATGAEFDKAKDDLKKQLESKSAETQFNEWFSKTLAEAKIVVNDPALRAMQFVQNNQLPQAVSQYQEAIEENPDDPYLHLYLGEVYKQLEDPDRAIGEYELAVSKGDSDAELHYVLGLAYKDKGEKDKAVAEFRKASGLDLTNYGLHSALKDVFTSLKMTAEAKAEQGKMDEIMKIYQAQQKAAEEQAKAQAELQKKLDEQNKQQQQSGAQTDTKTDAKSGK